MRRWRRGRWSDTSPARGCVSEQINQQSDGSARSCVTEISLVVVFRVSLYCAPPRQYSKCSGGRYASGCMNMNVWRRIIRYECMHTLNTNTSRSEKAEILVFIYTITRVEQRYMAHLKYSHKCDNSSKDNLVSFPSNTINHFKQHV